MHPLTSLTDLLVLSFSFSLLHIDSVARNKQSTFVRIECRRVLPASAAACIDECCCCSFSSLAPDTLLLVGLFGRRHKLYIALANHTATTNACAGPCQLASGLSLLCPAPSIFACNLFIYLFIFARAKLFSCKQMDCLSVCVCLCCLGKTEKEHWCPLMTSFKSTFIVTWMFVLSVFQCSPLILPSATFSIFSLVKKLFMPTLECLLSTILFSPVG